MPAAPSMAIAPLAFSRPAGCLPRCRRAAPAVRALSGLNRGEIGVPDAPLPVVPPPVLLGELFQLDEAQLFGLTSRLGLRGGTEPFPCVTRSACPVAGCWQSRRADPCRLEDAGAWWQVWWSPSLEASA